MNRVVDIQLCVIIEHVIAFVSVFEAILTFISVKIGYWSCAYSSTVHGVGVMLSYECGVVNSRQLHLDSTCYKEL